MIKKVLLIDDNPDTVTILSDILTEKGYEVITSNNPGDGLIKVKKENPDIVLLDTQMPGMDGFEVCAAIKKGTGKVPKVIIYTATIGAVNARKAKLAGADDYIVKTSETNELVNAIKELM